MTSRNLRCYYVTGVPTTAAQV